MFNKLIYAICVTGLLGASAPIFATDLPVPPVKYDSVPYRGVNLAGAEFHGGEGGKYNTDGFLGNLPTVEDAFYFVYKGVNTVRLPFSLEYLVPSTELAKVTSADYKFTSAYANKLFGIIDDLTRNQKNPVFVILDMHNYMHYNPDNISNDYDEYNKNFIGDVLGVGAKPAVTTEQFAFIWAAIAKRIGDNKNVAFGLMNEPQGVDAVDAIRIQQAAVNQIRKAEGGFKHLVIYDGTKWSGLHSFIDVNSKAFLDVKGKDPTKDGLDPASNYAIDLHQYFDDNFSGTKTTCVAFSADKKQSIEKALDWFKQNNIKLFVGEFGAPYMKLNTTTQKFETIETVGVCRTSMDYLLDLLVNPENGYTEQVLGFTVWAAGHAWGDYIMNNSLGGPANNWWETETGSNKAELFGGVDGTYFKASQANLDAIAARRNGIKILAVCNHLDKYLTGSSVAGEAFVADAGGIGVGECRYIHSIDGTLDPDVKNHPNGNYGQMTYSAVAGNGDIKYGGAGITYLNEENHVSYGFSYGEKEGFPYKFVPQLPEKCGLQFPPKDRARGDRCYFITK